MIRIRTLTLLGLAIGIVPTTQIRAQEAPQLPRAAGSSGGTEWFPASFVVAPLRAAPLEVRLAGGFIAAERDLADDFEGRNLEAQVAIGYPIPVVRFQDEAFGRPGIDLGFEVGVFSRFFMETDQKDLIDVDYRVGVPLGVRYGRVDVRLTLLHVSSHVGDDYLEKYPRQVFQSSREGFELLVGARPGLDVRVYVGGDLNLGRSEDFLETGDAGEPFLVFTTVEKWALRFGAEWDPTEWSGRRIAPFAAANFETTELTERLSAHLKAGAAFGVRGVRLLLDLEVHDGPSPLGQFRTVDESWLGANLTVEL